MGILGGTLCIAGVLGTWYFGTGHEIRNTFGLIFLVSISISMTVLGLYSAVAVLREKVVLTPDAIELIGIIKTTRVRRDEISGYRFMSVQGINYIELTPNDPKQRKIKVTILCLPDEEFSNWFKGVENFNQKEYAASLRKIEQNPALGETPLARIDNNSRARKIAQSLNAALYAEGAWALFYPHPYMLMVVVIAATPWIAIGLCYKYGDSFAINDPGINSAEADLTRLLFLPGVLLSIRALVDVMLLDWAQLVFPSIIGGLIIMACAARVSPGLRSSIGKLVFVALLQVVYVGSVMTIVNVKLDGTPPENFKVTVLSKHQTTGKGPKLFFTISPWGSIKTNSEIPVSCDLYKQTSTGDIISIQLHAGSLGLPWYTAGESPRC